MAQHDPILTLYITTVDYNRRDPVFWIQAETNMTKYKHKQRRFPRYYSELQKLDRHLVSTLDDVLLPVLPFCPQPHQDKDGSVVPRRWWLHIQANNDNRNHKRSSSSTRLENQDTSCRIEEWDTHIQAWLERITSHPRATLNEGLREFVESEVGFRPQSKPQKRHKKISGFGHQDMDMEFTLRLNQLDEFGQQLFTVEQFIQVQMATQAVYSDFWLDLASGWVAYGSRERHPLLFIVYKTLAKGCQQLANIERSQEFLMAETLSSQIQYQIRNVEAAKTSLHRRATAFTDYLACRKHTESCLRHVDRLKSSSNIDRARVNDVIDDLELARSDEQSHYQRYRRIDTNLDHDLEVLYKRSVTKDMIAAIREYARGQLHLEKQKLELWQSMHQHLV